MKTFFCKFIIPALFLFSSFSLSFAAETWPTCTTTYNLHWYHSYEAALAGAGSTAGCASASHTSFCGSGINEWKGFIRAGGTCGNEFHIYPVYGDWPTVGCTGVNCPPVVYPDVDDDGYPDRCDLYPGDPGQPESISYNDYIYSYNKETGERTGISCIRVKSVKNGVTQSKLVSLSSGGCDLAVTSGPDAGKTLANIPEPPLLVPITQSAICSYLSDPSNPYPVLNKGEQDAALAGAAALNANATNALTPSVGVNADGTIDTSQLPTGVTPTDGDYSNSTSVNQALIENQRQQIEQQANATATQNLKDKQEEQEADNMLEKLQAEVAELLGLSGFDFDTTLPPPADFEEGETVTYWFEFLENNAFNDVISEVGITASDGGCTYSGSWSLRGVSHSETINFCKFEDTLVFFGNILVCLASFNAVAMILTGRWFL